MKFKMKLKRNPNHKAVAKVVSRIGWNTGVVIKGNPIGIIHAAAEANKGAIRAVVRAGMPADVVEEILVQKIREASAEAREGVSDGVKQVRENLDKN